MATGYNTSYEIGYDNLSGWGERYFYTYYSEFGERKLASTIEAVVLISIFVFSFIGNILIICAVCRFREMRNNTNYFLLNLSAADLVFAFSIPAIAYTRIQQNWSLGDVACKIVPYSQFVCCFVLLWTLTLISMDRYRCIVVPPYRSQLTPTRTTCLITITWSLAIIFFLPLIFWFREQRVHDEHIICTLIFPKSEYGIPYSLCFTLPILFIAGVLPMMLQVYFYHQIFRKIVRTRNRWNVPCVLVTTENGCTTPIRRDSDISMLGSIMPVSWTRKFSISSQTNMTLNGKVQLNGRHGSMMSHHEEHRLNKHVRVVRLLLLNVIVILLMWLPITVVSFLIYQDGARANDNTDFFLRSHHFVWCLMIALLNTVVNPFLYGVFSENFRSCFLKWWFNRRHSNHNRRNSFDNNNRSNNESYNNNTMDNNKVRTPSTARTLVLSANLYNNKVKHTLTVSSTPRKNSSVESIAEYPTEEN